MFYNFEKNAKFLISAGFLIFSINCAFAGVVLNTTRVIYNSDKEEVTVKVTNNNKSPVLIQNWIDQGDVNLSPEKIVVPFVLTPSINRIDPGKGQTIRISYLGTPTLPTNKESVYWLNVLEVPAKIKSMENNNKVNVAFRTRIKLFYRPAGLPGNANSAPKQLRWQIVNDGVQASNPTPYYVNLGTVTYTINGKKYDLPGEMVAPGDIQTFHFKDISKITDLKNLTYSAINDYGAFVDFTSNSH